jgi:peptidyl-prolyl isomerase E (cyclophilin E)
MRVNYAQPAKIKGGDKGWASQAVWADADDWYERAEAEQQLAALEEETARGAVVAQLAAAVDPMAAAEAAALAANG